MNSLAPALLDELLQRLDWPTPQADVVSWDEVSTWPAEAFARLQAANVLQPTEPARTVLCQSCDEGHASDVVRLEDASLYAFCPDFGTTELDPRRLECWRIDLGGLANLCGIATPDFAATHTVLAFRLLDLGVCTLAAQTARTFLARGLVWDDAPSILEAIEARSGTGDALVLVPAVAPAPQRTSQLSIIPLSGNLEDNGTSVRFRLPVVIRAQAGDRVFRKEGDAWPLAFGDESKTIKDSVGMVYIRQLLRQPNTLLACSDLVARGERTGQDGTALATEDRMALSVSTGGDAGEVIDPEAAAAYRAQYEKLKGELRVARADGNSDAEERVLIEMQWLGKELSGGLGLDGRPRKARSTSDRSRTAVKKAIDTAINNISTWMPLLGAHLASTIQTGSSCIYQPDEALEWST